MKWLSKIFFVSIIVFAPIALSAQSAKKHYKAGQDFAYSGNHEAAAESFTRAIDLDPEFEAAYVERGEAYIELKKLDEALADFEKAAVFNERNPDIFANIGEVYFRKGENEKALENVNKAIDLRKAYVDPYYVKYEILMTLKKYQEAIEVADFALRLANNEENYYRIALAYEMMDDFDNAEKNYERAVGKNRKFVDGYIALANILLKKGDFEEAHFTVDLAFRYEENSRDAHLVKSKIYAAQVEFPKAINEISTVLSINSEDEEMYLIRGNYYQKFTQHQSAILDYNKVLLINNENIEAYFKRAYSYEQTANYKKAIEDYKKVAELTEEGDIKAQKLLVEAEKRLFELNREENNPEITLIDPVEVKEFQVNLPKGAAETTLKGLVKDESEITEVTVNNQPVQFIKTDEGFEFLTKLNFSGKEIFIISAKDAYGNVNRSTYNIKLTEVDAPLISIIAPMASDNGEIMLDNLDPNIYVEGKIHDESKIKSIFIEGKIASFSLEEFNPSFNANISVTNKDKITVVAEDIYGNKKEQVFTLNRQEAQDLANNPMGKTWVVFIENSNYKNFASLEGPSKDVTLMKVAFAKYKINKVIQKKDMTKSQMERFFSIELRDLIRSNKVNSILIWYAGHGKFVNETGYWIPVDANRDDEFTYFNINNLKGSMQGYSKYITHTLVITDACESGPTFYQAMRNTPKEKSCDDWQAVKFKSSQVFSSAGYELAVDNSQFTRTFARTLRANPNACIPIEKIVNSVTQAVASSNQQKPKFGKISGLEDEDGTFFFMAK